MPRQLAVIVTLTANCESLELLWLPGGVQLVTWTKGVPSTYLINEDGGVTNG